MDGCEPFTRCTTSALYRRWTDAANGVIFSTAVHHPDWIFEDSLRRLRGGRDAAESDSADAATVTRHSRLPSGGRSGTRDFPAATEATLEASQRRQKRHSPAVHEPGSAAGGNPFRSERRAVPDRRKVGGGLREVYPSCRAEQVCKLSGFTESRRPPWLWLARLDDRSERYAIGSALCFGSDDCVCHWK